MRILLPLLASTILAAPALAAETAAQPQAAHGAEEHDHHDDAQDIVVTAPFVAELDLLAGKSVLSGDDLTRDNRAQIGDTLVRLPGVSATSFSPGASRPVLRGFQGERVRVLTDGIGSIDVSNTSADHAVTIEPLTAERVEVLRGPAALLFGGQALGGVVNVIDRRIPRALPAGGSHVDLIGGLGSAADEVSIGGAVNLALGSGFVAHVDGSFRRTGDLEVAGFVLSPAFRAELLEEAAEELAEGETEKAEELTELAGQRDVLPNSGTEQRTFAGGLAYIAGPLSLGVSLARFESDYGIQKRPGMEHDHGHGGDHGGDHEEEKEEVSIGLGQTRWDLRGEYALGGDFLEQIRLRVGGADYTHSEIKDGEAETTFDNQGVEGRLELVQADRNGWRGASGLQLMNREFDAVGEEAFLRRNSTWNYGIFTLQEWSLGNLGLEAAARYERSEVESQFFNLSRDFDALSGAVGINYAVLPGGKIGFNLSRTTRAPSAEELFSNGPHLATSAFEIGNPDLVTEKSLGGELFFRWERSGLSVNAAAFLNRFDDFIYEDDTGLEEDDLPVFRYLQRDADFRGFEIDVSGRLGRVGGLAIVADGVIDYVRATLRNGGGNVPRIPPLRLLGGLEAQSNRLDARAEVEWVDDQTRIATYEKATDGHTLVNASLAWHPLGKRQETSIILSANNIFDVEARRHASFTKDWVPLAGRDIRLSARFAF